MTKKAPDNFRIRINRTQEGHRPHITYIVRTAGRVIYMSADETPLALSNLIHDDAASMRFAMEDAKDGGDAAAHLRKVLAAQFANNPKLNPNVEVLP